MQIGIGLPGTIPEVSGPDILEWARRADEGPFSSLGIIDRLVYSNFEPLITLAAAAGATRRIGLLPSVLLAPLHSAALLAKQVASPDALSGGRLTLGPGIGGRMDDYAAAGTSFADRGRHFDEQLATMKRVWAGEPFSADVGAIGPPPAQEGGPPILIGGFGAAALRRVGRWGKGSIGTLVDPGTAKHFYDQATAAWQAAGRTGRPRFVMGLYYALGEDAAERGGTYLRHYYAFDAPMAEMIVGSVLATPEVTSGAIRAYEEVGVDEIIFWPTIAAPDQLDQLAESIG